MPLLSTLLAGLVAATALAWSGPAAASPTLVALLVELAAAVTFGALLMRTLTTGPGAPGRAPRSVPVAAALWVLSAATVAAMEPGTRGYWTASAVAGAVVGLAGLRSVSWNTGTVLTGLAGLGVAVGTLATPVASGTNGDLGSNAVVLFTLAGAAWFGSLLAVGPARPGNEHAQRRYRVVASTAAAVGVLDGSVLLATHSPGVTTPLLWVAVVAGVVSLAHVLAPVRLRPGAAVTLVALVVGAGAVAGLVGGVHASPAASSMLRVLGYRLSGAPTVAALSTTWRFDLVLGSASILLALVYLLGVRTLRRRGDTWATGRVVAWLAGCVALLITTSSGVGAYSRGMFSVYMVVHMSLNMFIPVLLVLGGPVTLALRTMPHGGGTAGPREWLLAMLHSRGSRLLTNPLTAILVFLVTLYGVYFTDIFTAAQQHPWGYELLNIHFLITGYLFYYGIIGIDPGPARPPFLARLGVLFAVMPFHAFFGIAIMSMSAVIGESFYRGLALPWVGDLLSDEHTGGAIAWVSGEVPLILVAMSLLAQWSRQDERTATRSDRHADSDGDSELEAYNAMLAELVRNRR
ncbi:MAG: cytochrome c oxidase assembly protein [Mycobacteriaceae bacterium]